MSDKIVNLDDFRPQPAHLSGMASCLACKHQWAATAPVGTGDLECPSCGLMRGAWQYGVSPPVGATKYVCVCGCDVYRLSTKELLCIACGRGMFGWYVGQDPCDPSRGPRPAA